MKINVQQRKPIFTHEGGPSTNIPAMQRLKRLTMACMLWEDTFYVDGKKVTEQIEEVCKEVSPLQILITALDCHEKGFLRHIPLFLIVQALKYNKKIPGCPNYKDVIYQVCNRPDQMTELLSLYWKDGKKPLPAQLKKGLAKAFTRFDAYQLAKYDRDTPIKLRDVLFLSHAKPITEEQATTWKQLISKTLPVPETWETKLSAGNDKKESFQELLEKGKMGKLAIIRNLRNMQEAGVSKELVEKNLQKNDRPLLPFQFLAAAKMCPQWENMVDAAMIQSIQRKDKIPGNTFVLVDVSGSMSGPLSAKSQMNRMDAACGIAILLRELCQTVEIFSFSEQLKFIPPRQGMALRDAIITSQSNGGTYIGKALNTVKCYKNPNVKIDRIIVITDEQCRDSIPIMDIPKCYVINVGTYENGIQNKGEWLTVNGFSEHVIDYIIEIEKDNSL